jgi:hypothetical protein
MAVAVAGVSADRSGLASGLINVGRIVGTTVGGARPKPRRKSARGKVERSFRGDSAERIQ